MTMFYGWRCKKPLFCRYIIYFSLEITEWPYLCITLVNCNNFLICYNLHSLFSHISNITAKKKRSLQWTFKWGNKRRRPCTCFYINQCIWKQKNYSTTLERAHKLKWTIYSFFFIPPFPTSSMSGSVEFTCSMDIMILNG